MSAIPSRPPIWPSAHRDPLDPFADQERPTDLGWEDHRMGGGKLRREMYDALATRLLALLDAVQTGALALSETPDGDRRSVQRRREDLDQLLNTLRISRRMSVDHRAMEPPSPWVPTDDDLARVTTDLCPAAMLEAADRMLGPLADELDPRRPEHRRTQLVVLAAYCFTVADGELDPGGQGVDPGQSPFDLWSRRKPLPSVEERAAFRAVERAPWTAWTLVRALGDDRWWVEDIVGIDARRRPDGPVRMIGAAAPLRAPRAGDTLMARLVRTPEGWETRAAIVLPGGPPTARVRSWVRLELVRQRLRDRRLTVDALLRRRGFVLARHLCEWAWHHGDDDPYGMPDLYDLEYHQHDEDVPFYLNQARAAAGRPILELGCGTGRLALQLAGDGHEVHGVDLSESMLARFLAKLDRAPDPVRARVTARRGDFRTFDAPAVYGLVILPFNAMHHCRSVEELVAVFTTARTALAPGGRFVLDCYLEDLDLYDRDPDERYEERTFVDPRTGEVLHSWEQGWWDPDVRVHHVMYVYEHADGRREGSHLQLRMFTLDEIRAAVTAAGLRILREAEDFDGRPMGDDALKYVVVTQAK